MKNKFEDWNKYRSDVNKIIVEYFNKVGIMATTRALYFSFAQKILAIVKKHQDGSLINKLIEGNIQYFVTAFDANEKVLRDIVKIIILAKIEKMDPDDILEEVLTQKAN
ncbi:putative coat protein [Metallosphaera rod-shaped virus 1]|uniref:Putative coat protein n=1 Tax=Metallosphaera rod-shaped virus 1 TaxID=2730618 RepID=A0A6M3VZ56_9VIRU|nr:putative coat protein [Metallosphaera rod-shaped virus 1]QJF12355.1 putative coat protein [Metallosphaera rod-shaped virus 1]